jgi:hypothetical protein
MIIEIGKLNETETVCTLCKIRKATVRCYKIIDIIESEE